LHTLSPSQLILVKRSLQKYFYVTGTNIALYEALGTDETKKFKEKTRKAIEKQILHIAEFDKLSQIVSSKKKSIDSSVLLGVVALWSAFHESLDGGREEIFLFLVWAGTQGGQSGLDKMIPPSRKFELTNLEIRNKLNNRVDFLLKTVDKTGTEWVARTIQDGLEQGLSTAEITKYLRSEAKQIAEERADLISETELAYAMGLVEVETFRRNGIEKYRWITAEDERVCEICMANEAAGEISIGEEFPMGVVAPPQHVRCRCFLIPTLPTMIEQIVWSGS